MTMGKSLVASLLVALAIHSTLAQLSFGASGKDSRKDASPTLAPRLGLLASSLGVPPVPGASYGDNSGDSTLYSNGGGFQGGNVGDSYAQPPAVGPAPIKSCKCIPRQLCLDPAAQQLIPPSSSGNPQPGYGPTDNSNGNPQPGYPSNSNGSPQPDYPPSSSGNPQPGYPSNSNGSPQPDYPPSSSGNPQPGYPSSSSGNPQSGYPSGIDSGIISPVQPGYTEGDGGSDGAGVIDIRIVNRPPGGVVCLAGEVYCCNGGSPSQPIHGGNDPYPQSPNTCGYRQAINVPGHSYEYGQAKFGEYPFLAVMLGPNNNYLGAGALLDSYNILTAAHKVKDYVNGGFKVRLGEWNAQADDEPYKNVEVEVARVDIHPAFNAQNLQNDVAIVRLSQPVSINTYPHIKSVCLPKHGASFVGTRCYVAGFGKDAFQVGKHSYILREVDVPVIESNECEQRLRGTRLGSYFNLNRKSFLCAGGEEGKDACTGDGGSPLVCERNGRFEVVGLVAWGIGCADYGIPGVYVNVGNYVNWIQSIVQSSNALPPQQNKPSY